MAKKYTCPYCFKEHEFEDVEFRCVNGFCSEKTQDEKYAQYLGLKKESMPLTNATFCAKTVLPKLFRCGRIARFVKQRRQSGFARTAIMSFRKESKIMKI